MTSSHMSRIVSISAAVALTLAACGGSDNSTPTPPPEPANPLERDVTFGAGGEARITGASSGYVEATALQADSTLLLGGSRPIATGGGKEPRRELFVRRLLVNGKVDTSFGQAGETVFSVLGNDRVQDILMQPDGKIVVVLWAIEPCDAVAVGRCLNAAGVDAEAGTGMLRLNTDGTRDNSFGNQGLVSEYGRGGQRSAPAPKVVLQPDGKLLKLETTSDHIMRLYSSSLKRYLPNGSVDPAFNGGLSVTPRCMADGDVLGLQADGHILVAGAGLEQGVTTLCIDRLKPDGQGDNSFPLTRSDVNVRPTALRVLPNGDLQLAGQAFDASGSRLFGLRQDATGAPRKDYGADGIAYLPASGSAGSYEVQDIAIDAAGAVLASSAFRVSVGPTIFQRRWLKLLANGQADTGFAPGGILAASSLPAGYGAVEWLVDPQGRWITLDRNVSESVVTRFKGTQP